MRKLCVIGDPIGHSLSPVIQNAMIQAAGLDYVYDARRVAGTDTACWLKRAAAEGYVGFNATMPHKENLVELVDELSADAALFRSVNTVCLKDGRVYGHNTDGIGFLRALRQADMDPADKTVLVLGAGGAAKAVASKLSQSGARTVFVANRTWSRAQELCARLEGDFVPCDFSPETLCRCAEQSQLLVNCTALGMKGTDTDFEDLSFLRALPAGGGVFDLIYSPARTKLLYEADRLGHPVSNGLGMLIWQAVFALEYFTETKLDGPAMAAAARRALEAII